MKNAFKCPITTKLTFVHLFSFPLRKHLERFPSFAFAFASLSLEMRKRTHPHHSLVFATFQISKLSCLAFAVFWPYSTLYSSTLYSLR